MNLYNATEFSASYSMGIQKSGRNCLVIVAKATFMMPFRAGQMPFLADKQIPLYETDAYTGEPGLSAPIYENDYATHKPKCDVILHGSAYAYPEKQVEQRIVSLNVAELKKSFRVVGARYWQKTPKGNIITKPQAFSQQSMSYDTAYGGSDLDQSTTNNEQPIYTTFMENPIGQGYYPNQDKDSINGQPLPLTEAINDPIKDASSTQYQPQSFGLVARNWKPRYLLGGTYDQYWQENTKPFLPDDFDEHYYQCAPKDQQIAYLRGGETVRMEGLTPYGFCEFQLPKEKIPMQVILSHGKRHNLAPVIDTLILEPDLQRFTLVWRARIGLRRDIHEVDTLIVGKPTPAWERARMMNKLFLPLSKINAFRKAMKKQMAEEQRLREKNQAGGRII